MDAIRYVDTKPATPRHKKTKTIMTGTNKMEPESRSTKLPSSIGCINAANPVLDAAYTIIAIIASTNNRVCGLT